MRDQFVSEDVGIRDGKYIHIRLFGMLTIGATCEWAKMDADEHQLASQSGKRSDELCIVDIAIAAFALALIAYVVYIEFDLWPLLISLALTLVGIAFYRERLREFHNDETLYWTMLAALGLFAVLGFTLSSGTADITTDLVLATTFIVSIVSLWTKNVLMIAMVAFLLTYLAFRLLWAHLPT